MKTISPLQKLQRLADKRPLIRASDAVAAGIPRMALSRLAKSGAIRRMARGLYRTVKTGTYDHPDMLEACLLVPKGLIVLLSALNFHGIGTHPAWEVWMQLPANYPTPKVTHPPLRIVRSRMPAAFTEGVETHIIAGYPVKITSLDRTIVDCFKYRNLVTLELCLEALRERMKTPRRSLQNLHRFAAKMGVSRIIQPYLEALS